MRMKRITDFDRIMGDRIMSLCRNFIYQPILLASLATLLRNSPATEGPSSLSYDVTSIEHKKNATNARMDTNVICITMRCIV